MIPMPTDTSNKNNKNILIMKLIVAKKIQYFEFQRKAIMPIQQWLHSQMVFTVKHFLVV
jgi:hypothetical protein